MDIIPYLVRPGLVSRGYRGDFESKNGHNFIEMIQLFFEHFNH